MQLRQTTHGLNQWLNKHIHLQRKISNKIMFYFLNITVEISLFQFSDIYQECLMIQLKASF